MITIKKDQPLFVALCRNQDTFHSIIKIGTMYQGKYTFLGTYGKMGGFVPLPGATIGSEGGANTDIFYKAWETTYEEYIEFLKFLKKVDQEQKYHFGLKRKIGASVPTSENLNDGTVELTPKWLREYYTDTSNIDNKKVYQSAFFKFSPSNNCRHGAIQLAKIATGLENLGKGISSSWYKKPLLSATVEFNQVQTPERTDHFFILPKAPKYFMSAEPRKLKVLQKIYKRLDHLILMEEKNVITIDKFEKLKALYNNLAKNEQPSLREFFEEIVQWTTANKELITAHRRFHLFPFATATEKTMNKINDYGRQFLTK